MQQNYWLYEQDISEIGGLIGLSFECEKCNSFWLSDAKKNGTS